jgi:hypothetical protein
MGEAKRRSAEIKKLLAREDDWLRSLHGDERDVADVAIATFNRIVLQQNLTGGCYNLAFFLREYLARERGIAVEMVVGWVMDSSWDGGISHAWIEHGSKRTDVSIWKTEDPDVQIPGAVLIQDFEYRKGVTDYTYQRDLPQSARAYLDLAARNPTFGATYRAKEAEHEEISRLAAAPDGAAQYFSRAPQSMKYESLARMLAMQPRQA